MAVQVSPVKCRYRLITGCTAQYGSDMGRFNHEKKKHADIRVELRACPVCGEDCESAALRGSHLQRVHGITAGSAQRENMDAEQVTALVKARSEETGDDPSGAPAGDPFQVPAAVPSMNGHLPAPVGVSAAQEALAAILAEVEALRAENVALRSEAAMLQMVREIVTG